MPLTWAALQELQGVVLGSCSAPFRRGVARAKQGQEQYGCWEGMEQRFAERLALAPSVAPHPVARAAMLYLDLCFFHPFEDGNARAARLALDYTLSYAGLALGDCGLVFALPIPAGRRGAYLDFLARVVRACEMAAVRQGSARAADGLTGRRKGNGAPGI
ncbi:MAG: Fic family protein [Anaeromyxobacter sp.]